MSLSNRVQTKSVLKHVCHLLWDLKVPGSKLYDDHGANKHLINNSSVILLAIKHRS